MSTRHARTADKSTNDKHTRILKALLQKPENKFCVDCRKKVKSVDLDSWTVEQVENMIKWGNEKANMYWEARLPASSVPNESTSGIDPWIRSKYEHKQFARKGSLPDPSELGPIDEAMLMELYGKSESHLKPQAQMNRSAASSGSFSGALTPPPSNPTRSSFPKKPASSGLQGADLFSIGQQPSPSKAPAAQIDFFGLNDPVPAQAAPVQSTKAATNTPSQDLFSITPATTSASATPANNQAAASKPANTDWKNSIMSLYGNQPSAPKPNPGGFNMGQSTAPFGQLQGMDAFGFGQAPIQQQQQQQQQQHNPWGNDDAFGAMQQAGASTSNSSFDAFGSSFSNNSNNNNGFGTATAASGFMSANSISSGGNGFGAPVSAPGFMPTNGGQSNGVNNGVPQGGDFFSLIAGATRSPATSPPQNSNKNNSNDTEQPRKLSLESLPLECIQAILENLSSDCHALYALLLMNKSWFQMVLPCLYRSPMSLIDATWPKLSSYSFVLKKELPPSPSPARAPSPALADPVTTGDYVRSRAVNRGTTQEVTADTSSRSGRSPSNTRRTSTTSSSNGGYGFGYAPRTNSRSSSHSSTRSWTGDAFHHGRNDAVFQKDQRERLVKRKKTQVLWVLLNCTLSEEEHRIRLLIAEAAGVGSEADDNRGKDSMSTSSLLSLDINPDLDVKLHYFQPMVDYLSYYTHFHHPGLQFIIWKLFPRIEDASTVEWRLISHCPERIRELFLESVQLQDMVPLVSRLETLHRIKACHETWDIQGSIEFMRQHNQLYGTVQMLELEAYLPDKHDTAMDDNMSDLISQVDHLKVLELAGFESLRAQLDLIPRQNLKVLRLNCGTLNAETSPNAMSFQPPGVTVNTPGNKEGRMSVSAFLSQCRQLEELLLDPVDENMLEWAVQERRNFQAGLLPSIPTSPSLSESLVHVPAPALVPLKVLELSGTDSEHVALTISQAAEAFQDTLEVIKANSYSYESNRTLKNLSWRCPMPKLRVLKVVGRSNLPLDFRSLQYCPALKILDLSKYSGMRTCSEAALLNLKYLTQLEYLGLSSFDHLTDSTLRTILGCMPKLTHLRLAIGDSSASSMAASGSLYTSSSASINPNAMTAVKGSGSARNSSILGGGGSGSGSGGFSIGSGSGGGGGGGGSSSASGTSGIDMVSRSALAALSLTSPPAASSGSSPASSPFTTSPTPYQQQQPSGMSSLISSQYNSHYPPQPLLSPSTTAITSSSYYPFSGTGSSSINIASSISSVSSQSGTGGIGDMASSARSTSSLMDRFHQENNYLSLEGILDAIDGLSESKNQLKKLSIVLGKQDFEEHYRRLEQYNQLHLELEITVYRYAHAV
ncbi:hypothetical protein BGX26_004170 [Mortierella sp. AD094]|nr:hypothetical protein BGX26_004170 [Mortierella sp. AD094]